MVNLEVRFKAYRVWRQSDPLSPFLFTLAFDSLSILVRRAKGYDLEEGFVVRRDRIMVPNLYFADDTIFFLVGDENNLLILKNVVEVFGLVLGLR